jgi:RNA polymerase sigma-70 factor, ECF subfamily
MSRFWANRRTEGAAAFPGRRRNDTRTAPRSPAGEGVNPEPLPDEPADEVLLYRHVAGDTDAFGELVRRHRDRLWAVALRTLGDPEEAADAVQDALVAAFRRAHTFRGDAAVTTWLHRIVVNACLDRVRRRQVRPTVPLTEDGGDESASQVRATSPDHADDGELRLDIAAALLRLPAEQRAALVLVDMHGFAVQEAARILDVAAGTVKSRCARGRARLLPLLAHLRNPDATAPVQPVSHRGMLPPRREVMRGPSSGSPLPAALPRRPHPQGGDPLDAP